MAMPMTKPIQKAHQFLFLVGRHIKVLRGPPYQIDTALQCVKKGGVRTLVSSLSTRDFVQGQRD